MTRAVKVIGAGKASLAAIPIFVEEMLQEGIPLLKPLVYDHDGDTIQSQNGKPTLII